MEVVDLREVYCRNCGVLIGCQCIDDAGTREKSILRFSTSLKSAGFVQIVGHGIDEQIVSKSIDESQRFFNRDSAYKEGCISKDRARRGFSPALSENFATLIGVAGKSNDSVQKYRIGPVLDLDKSKDDAYYSTKEGRIHFYPNNVSELAEHFPVASGDYRVGMDLLAKQLLQLILHCSGVPCCSFDTVIDKHTSILSMNYYEPLGTNSHSEPIVRVEAHTDVSLITIVAQSAQSGTAAGALQVFIRDAEGGGEFVTVPYIPGALVVNVGDCLHDWSQGRFPSALHRVVNLPAHSTGSTSEENVGRSRYSLAYFYAPNYDAIMKWPDTDGTALDSIDYSTWRKNHIKKAMQKLKK